MQLPENGFWPYSDAASGQRWDTRTPWTWGARSVARRAAARAREARRTQGTFIEEPVTEIETQNVQNIPSQPPECLRYQQFQPEEKQPVTERQSVPLNPVRQRKFRN